MQSFGKVGDSHFAIEPTLLLPHPDNALTRLAHAVDHGLQRRLPRIGPWYRKATFVGRPRG